MNQSLIDAAHPGSYGDTPAPRVFGNVSPLDPQLFLRINDFADQLLDGTSSGKYSPVEVAQWLDDFADAATQHLTQAARDITGKPVQYRRLEIDVLIQAGLGHFFAAKFRSGVLYRIFENTGDRGALETSLEQYRKARAVWAELADRAKGIYLPDLTVGEQPQQHGHWLDRLPAIDRDISALAEKLDGVKLTEPSVATALAIKTVLGHVVREVSTCRHVPPARFAPGQPLEIKLFVESAVASVSLYYRHVNQAERFNVATMERRERQYQATIPATYTDSPYPLQYYFEIESAKGGAVLYPGLGKELTNQPYFVVRRA